MKLLERINNNETLYFDGGLGTLLQQNGLDPGEKSDVFGYQHPKTLIDIHKTYLNAGCNILTANTFSTNYFNHRQDEFSISELVDSAVKSAHTAIKETSTSSSSYIALDLGPTGQMIEPFGDTSEEEVYNAYREVILAGEKAGCDLILIETMIFSNEAIIAGKAAKENSSLPVFITFSVDKNGRLMSGEDIKALADIAHNLNIDGVGLNCGLGPDILLPFAKELKSLTSLPIIITPNAGLPHKEGDNYIYDMDALKFASYMKELHLADIHLLGGCCGTTPEYIQETIKICEN